MWYSQYRDYAFDRLNTISIITVLTDYILNLTVPSFPARVSGSDWDESHSKFFNTKSTPMRMNIAGIWPKVLADAGVLQPDERLTQRGT